MCGIFGAIKFNGLFDKKDLEQFVGLTDAVDYRGPDASGYKTITTKGYPDVREDNFNIFLGHRRLSIIDLSEAGNQPFTDESGLWIIYNGEIFNYIELREDLKKKGYTFQSDTDTEVILKVYAEYGEEGFGLLNGMWAFAIVDTANQRVVLSRDRFSIKPLYLCQVDNGFYFSSEIRQLLPFVKRREVNESVMFAYLRQSVLEFNDQTFFKGIYKAKAMRNLVINLTNQEINEKKYWDYSDEIIPSNEADITEQFRQLFIDSVKIRLRSDVPIGCLLSGGLDSSSIAVIASALLPDKLNCFSVISRDAQYSEEKFIDIVSGSSNINQTKLVFQNKAAWNDLSRVLACQEEPVAGFSVIAQNHIYQLIRENSDVKVVLSGQGGDEILCGYNKFFFFYLQETLKRGNIGGVLKNILCSLLFRTVLWGVSISKAKRYVRVLQNTKVDPLAQILNIQGELEPIWEIDNLRNRQTEDIDKYSVPALAHYEDRSSMAYSLEVRHPFLDHRLINFALNLSSEMKIRHGWTKYVLRKSIRELPKEIAWRRDKQGFITPEEKWIKHDFREEILSLFGSSKLDDLGIIHKEKLLECYKLFIKGNRLISCSDISRFIMAEIWCRNFFC